MDRSFLSDKQLIKASHDFVCIRTATYEDKEEAEFHAKVMFTRSGGALRNFGFCVLSPDGQQVIRRSDRGPNFLYVDSSAMAVDLREIASEYRGETTSDESNLALPQMKSVRLGINVASCDGLPSIVVVGKNPEETNQFKEKLSGVIWDEDLAGKFIFASTSNPADLKIVDGAASKTGILVIRPDTFGIKGQLITAIDPTVSDNELKASLADAADTFQRTSKTHGAHVRAGRRTDTTWETEVPVPDRQEGRRGSDSSSR